jgi:Ribosomal protein L13e
LNSKSPKAVVLSRNGIDIIQREGRGFSMGELTSAGLTASVARAAGVMVDVRRRSVLQENVDVAKGLKIPEAPKKTSESKPAEKPAPEKKEGKKKAVGRTQAEEPKKEKPKAKAKPKAEKKPAAKKAKPRKKA